MSSQSRRIIVVLPSGEIIQGLYKSRQKDRALWLVGINRPFPLSLEPYKTKYNNGTDIYWINTEKFIVLPS